MIVKKDLEDYIEEKKLEKEKLIAEFNGKLAVVDGKIEAAKELIEKYDVEAGGELG